MKNVICASYDPNIKVDRRYVFYDNKIPFRRSGIYLMVKEVKSIKVNLLYQRDLFGR